MHPTQGLGSSSETARQEPELKTVMSVDDSIGKHQSALAPSELPLTANYNHLNSIIESRDVKAPSLLHENTTMSQRRGQESVDLMSP